MPKHFIIIGGGIAGLTTAISLKQLGHTVKLYESKPNIHGLGAGLGLAANAMKALEYLGLAQALIPLGNMLRSLTIKDAKGYPIFEANTELVKNGSADNFSIHRKVLIQYLYEKLDEADTEVNKKLIKLVQTDRKVQLTFADGTQASGDYLIGCDGVGSAVRLQLLPQSKPQYAGYTCWRAITPNPNIIVEDGTEIWDKAGRFGFVPLVGNLIYWYACINTTTENYHTVKSYGITELLTNFKDFYNDIPHIIAHTSDADLIQSDILDIQPLKQFAFNRVLLIGDAAHATTPNMGQGACMAIEDVAVLIHELHLEKNPVVAFVNFEKKRLNRTKSVITKSKQIGWIAQLESPILCRIRDSFFRSLPQSFAKHQMQKLLNTDIFNP
ncbi:FAD-dependent monooxygenase [Flavobacterium sp. NKUCC04_CG]|uniref:FAD-dependent monooxygenase n=1 Tax=Flavobacterium sp. NKUCC04_CG TaxID=2842121 RepID=UPI001C5ABEEF|nr:FAD-dependent monooxygenase [Flavobacterium sp. NKUCC04_CG]MBW3518845.1 FAD-dependent monooxygenase [Flavobacterium sp. NKUCC04_CG]